MRRSIKLLVPFLILATAISCSDLFSGGNENGPEITLQATQSRNQTTTFNGDTLVFVPYVPIDSLPPRDYPPFTSEVQNSQVLINGYYLASAGGYIPTGEIEQTNNGINIVVRRGDDVEDISFAPIGWFYDAFISDLSPGTYTINIMHRDDLMRGSSGEEHTVFSKEFVIE